MKLFDRARGLLQGLAPAPPAKPQLYSVSCPEGHRLRGERTEGYQALRCPTCGEGIFVLPRSPLPEPASALAPRQARRTVPDAPRNLDEGPVDLTDPIPPGFPTADDPGTDAEIEWLEPEPTRVPVATPRPGPAPARPATAPKAAESEDGTARSATGPEPPRPRKKPSTRPSPTVDPVPQPTEPLRDRLGAWAWRHRHPLVLVAVACVVLGTVTYRVRWARRQALPRVAEIGRIQGLAALDAGKFDTAHQLLSEAERAVNDLGDAYEGAPVIHQGAREAAIFVNLGPEPLESILDAANKPDPDAWSSQFAALYKGRAIVVEAHVIATPDDKGVGRYELDYRIFPNGEGTRPARAGRIDLTGFQLFETTKPKVGQWVQFGARLDSLTLGADGREWLFGLEPDSGVSITHPKALEALGWPGESDLAAEEEAQP